jgi:hypothetical protein
VLDDREDAICINCHVQLAPLYLAAVLRSIPSAFAAASADKMPEYFIFLSASIGLMLSLMGLCLWLDYRRPSSW